MLRRSFLVWLAKIVGVSSGVAAISSCDTETKKPAPPTTADAALTPTPAAAAMPEPPAEKLSFFTAEEADTLRAFLDRVLPSDTPKGVVGARETGVINFIDAQLNLPHFAGLHRMIRAGIKFMDTVARRENGGKRFHELDGDKQDEIMTRFQTGKIAKLKFPQARFFSVMTSFAFEGYMSPPKYGGNHNKLAWKAHGFDLSCHHMFAPCEE